MAISNVQGTLTVDETIINGTVSINGTIINGAVYINGQGEQGLQGIQGNNGTNGTNGLQGIQGIQGESGTFDGIPLSGTTVLNPITGKLEYSSNLSATFTDRSLVDRGFVENNFANYFIRLINPLPIVTGTTAETSHFSLFIPANTLKLVDFLRIEELTFIAPIGLSGNTNIRIRTNTTNNFSTSTQICSVFSSSSASARIIKLRRSFSFKNTKIIGVNFGSEGNNDILSANYSEANFDVTIDNYFFFSTLTGSANQLFLNNLIITK
jgi:hypothetical protein